MNKLMMRSSVVILLIAILVGGMGYFIFEYVTQGQRWAEQTRNAHLYQNGVLKGVTVTDRNGQLLFSSKDGQLVWHEDEAVRRGVLHVIGDAQGNIGNGLIWRAREKWIGYDFFDGIYQYKKNGYTESLNLDAELSALAVQALGEYDGVVAMFNYQTGEILVAVSTEGFDPLSPPGVTADDGVYVNRFLSAAYTPGSIYKIVTLQAAIENLPELESMTFTCQGQCTVGGDVIVCSGVHGEQNIAQAFANSCNCAFGELAVAVGMPAIADCAGRAGLLATLTVDGAESEAGYLDTDAAYDSQVAWSGIGQHEDTVNPAAFLQYIGAIANEGEAVEMKWSGQGQASRRIMEVSTAQAMADYLFNNVNVQYGPWRFGDHIVGGKSGTAQQDHSNAHSVFTGFVADAETPVAFFVLAEQAGAGQGVALQIASTLVNAIKQEA